MKGFVFYEIDETGYTAHVMDAAGNQLDEYSAGNSRFDSQGYVSPNDSSAVPKRTLRKYARQTAREMADEHGIPRRFVSPV